MDVYFQENFAVSGELVMTSTMIGSKILFEQRLDENNQEKTEIYQTCDHSRQENHREENDQLNL